MRRAIVALCAIAVFGSCAAAFADPPAFIILSTPKVFGSLSRAAVRFTHGDHAKLTGVSCLTCHHAYKDGKNILDISTLTPGNPAILCATCHTSPRDLETSYHQLCITCHDTAKAKGGVTGPRACGDCHTWDR
jgi:hypothetical protein